MLSVEVLNDTPVSRRRIELVERKGLGHPDTISDSLVEAISVALNQMYLDVHLAARIGEPVDRPWTGVQVILPAGVKLEDVDTSIRAVVEAEVGRMREFRSELIRGVYPIC